MKKITVLIFFSVIFCFLVGCSADIEDVRFKENELTLVAGTSESIDYVVTPENAKRKTLHWESSDENIVKVSDDGTITAVSDSGTCEIKVSTDNGLSSVCTVIIKTEADIAFDRMIEAVNNGDKEEAVLIYQEELADTIYKYVESSDSNSAYWFYVSGLIDYDNGNLTSAYYKMKQSDNLGNSKEIIDSISKELKFLSGRRTGSRQSWCYMRYSDAIVYLGVNGSDEIPYHIIKSKYTTGNSFYGLCQSNDTSKYTYSSFDPTQDTWKGCNYALTPYDDGSILVIATENDLFSTFNDVYG